MSSESASVPEVLTVSAGSKGSFFTHGGWLIIATFVGGAAMYAVHLTAPRMPKGEYAVLGTLIQWLNLMGVPALGLQTAFAQQAARANSERENRQLCGTARGVMLGIFVIWLVMALGILLLREKILKSYGISNPIALWAMTATALVSMWLPVFGGLLQGRQDFKWLGWVVIMNGLGRFSIAMLAVVALGGYAAGGMSGVLAGAILAMLISGWRTRGEWTGATEAVDWPEWLGRVAPLTIGWAVCICMLSADGVLVPAFFSEQITPYYIAAGMIGRALVFFSMPLAVVMFPRVVAATTRSEASRALWQALATTGGVSIAGAIFCTALPWLPLRIIYNQTYADNSSPLVPWFMWSMLPLTLVNVLVNFLLAKRCWRALPVLLAIVLAYGLILWGYLKWGAPTSVVPAIQIVGVFNCILLVVSALFAWWCHRPKAARVT